MIQRNDGSHGPIDDLYAADPLMTNRHYMEEFKRFFALMGSGGQELLYTLSAQYIPSKIVIHA